MRPGYLHGLNIRKARGLGAPPPIAPMAPIGPITPALIPPPVMPSPSPSPSPSPTPAPTPGPTVVYSYPPYGPYGPYGYNPYGYGPGAYYPPYPADLEPEFPRRRNGDKKEEKKPKTLLQHFKEWLEGN